MTGVLELLSSERYKNRIHVDTSHCLEYVRRQSVSNKEIIFTVHLPYDGLREWCGARQKASARQIPCSFVDILNAFLFERTGFRVKSNCQRIEERLRKLCSEVNAKFVGKNGTRYRKLCLKESRLYLQLVDLETLSEVENELNEMLKEWPKSKLMLRSMKLGQKIKTYKLMSRDLVSNCHLITVAENCQM